MALTKYFSKSVSVYEDASAFWLITITDFAGHAVTWSSAWSTAPVCGITIFNNGQISWRCATAGTYRFTWTALDTVTGDTAIVECTITISGTLPPDGDYHDYYPYFTNSLSMSEGSDTPVPSPDQPDNPQNPSGDTLQPPQTYVSNIPCPIRISCPGSDFPITNYSAEGPQDISPYHSAVYPTTWFKGGCLSICESTVSQEEADQCALAQEAACSPPPPPILYCNTEQSVEVACSDGVTISSFTAQAGLFCAFTSQADVDAQALAYAQLQANALCPPPGGGTLYCSNEQTCSYVCPTTLETITFTAPASLFCAYTSQAEVDAFAYDFACGQAASRCPPTIDPPGYTTFLNTAQTCLELCPGGTSWFGFTVPAGIFAGPTQAAANAQAHAYACSRASLSRICLSDISHCGCVGTPYLQVIYASGVSGPVNMSTWSVSPGYVLPPGFHLNSCVNSSSCGLIGNPTLAGGYLFRIRATLPNGTYAEREIIMHVLSINNTSLADYAIGVPYSETLVQSGCTGTPVWSIASGTLPAGLTLNPATGVISGTPT